MTILNHKPRQRKTALTKHLSCERLFRGVCWDVRRILKCNFFFLSQGVNLFIVMETIRENLQHTTTSKTQTISERLGGRGGGGRGEWRERVRRRDEWGRRSKERETGRMANRQPHQTTTPHIRKMDEGGGRLQFIPSSAPNFSFFLASLSACLSFIFRLPNSLFLISHCLAYSICVTSCPSVSSVFFILFLSYF